MVVASNQAREEEEKNKEFIRVKGNKLFPGDEVRSDGYIYNKDGQRARKWFTQFEYFGTSFSGIRIWEGKLLSDQWLRDLEAKRWYHWEQFEAKVVKAKEVLYPKIEQAVVTAPICGVVKDEETGRPAYVIFRKDSGSNLEYKFQYEYRPGSTQPALATLNQGLIDEFWHIANVVQPHYYKRYSIFSYVFCQAAYRAFSRRELKVSRLNSISQLSFTLVINKRLYSFEKTKVTGVQLPNNDKYRPTVMPEYNIDLGTL